MFISSSRPGQIPFKSQKMRVVNRAGATALAVGDVVAFDVDASDAATQALSGVGSITLSSLTEAMFHNVVNVGAAPLNAMIAVVTNLLSGAGADNTEIEVQISGRVKAKTGGTNWAAAYSSCGVGVMADTTGANRRLVLATDGANTGKVGMIVEAVDTDLSAANQQLTEVLLLGWGSSVGSVGA